ncbi:MAG: hypothetical protein ABSE73_20695 [Planctomycetota bacterium]
MVGEQMRELKRARPFRPFVVLLDDGRRIPVTNPEWILVTDDGSRAAVFQKDDSLDMFQTRLVKEIKVRGPKRRERARNT